MNPKNKPREIGIAKFRKLVAFSAKIGLISLKTLYLKKKCLYKGPLEACTDYLSYTIFETNYLKHLCTVKMDLQ